MVKDLFNQAKQVEKGIGFGTDDIKLESCIAILNNIGLEVEMYTKAIQCSLMCHPYSQLSLLCLMSIDYPSCSTP